MAVVENNQHWPCQDGLHRFTHGLERSCHMGQYQVSFLPTVVTRVAKMGTVLDPMNKSKLVIVSTFPGRASGST